MGTTNRLSRRDDTHTFPGSCAHPRPHSGAVLANLLIGRNPSRLSFSSLQGSHAD
jgi:hypothetical protein